MIRAVAIALALTAVAAVAPAQAPAYYGNGAALVSADLARLEQGDDLSNFAAVSGNGRYVAFTTRARNFFADDDPDPAGRYRVGGIFRRDLETGRLELVADGDLMRKSDDSFEVRGAQDPAISADGRWVAFHTAQKLVAADTNDNVDVYVRDMSVRPRAPGAYELISAKEGGDVPASYEPRPTPFPGRNPGSDSTRAAAISADGRLVVFKTADVRTDLPASATTDTPPNQLFVRDRTLRTTTLITKRMGTGDPAGGAQGPAGISADGSTVVWTGKNAPEQTPFLNGETAENNTSYYLWRRIADALPATRRITGAYDLDDPGCAPGSMVGTDPTATGPCYGPLTDPEGIRADISGLLPAVSADGRRVAFLTGAGPRPNNLTGTGLDLYLTDMSPGQSRKSSTVELTREGVQGDPGASTPIDALAMSGDGRLAAIATFRTTFALPALRLTTPPATTPDAREVYVVDLDARNVERATRDFAGGEINPDGAVRGLTMSSDGGRVAFASGSSDHFFGDANNRTDAFAITRQPEPVVEPPPPPPPPDPPPIQFDDPDTRAPTLGARIARRSDGMLKLTVAAPSAGTLDVDTRARVPSRRDPKRLVIATVRRKRKLVKKAGTVTLVLKPTAAYVRELRRRGRLSASVVATFRTAPSGALLKRTLRGTFTYKRAVKK